MKYIPFALVLLMCSCSNTPQEQAILDYEQTILGTKTDLSMKIVSLEKVKDLTAEDSVRLYLDSRIEGNLSIEDVEKQMLRYDSLAAFTDSMKTHYAELMQAEYAKPPLKQNYDKIDIYIEAKYQYSLKASEAEGEAMLRRAIVEKANKIKAKTGVLATLYKCTYTIKNPMLNNVKQELTKTYVFSPSGQIVDAYMFGGQSEKQ